MRKNELAEVKKMDIKALKERIKKAKVDYVGLVLDKSVSNQSFSSGKASGKLTNLKALDHKRKEVAQMLTVLAQKQLLEKLEKAENK